MDWSQLRTANCPSCGDQLSPIGMLDNVMSCRNLQCAFKISQEKLLKIGIERTNFKPGDITSLEENI